MAAEVDHQALADVLNWVTASVVLSGHDGGLYRQLFATWYRVEIATATGQAHTWNKRTEVLSSNRPLGSARRLFDQPLLESLTLAAVMLSLHIDAIPLII